MLRHPSLKHRATMPSALSMALAWYISLPQPQSFILVLLRPCIVCCATFLLCSFHVPCAPSSLSMFLYMCSFYVRALLVLFLVLPACVLWAVFMLICPFHAGTWPIAADRCGSVRWSDLSCGCAVPHPHPSPQFLKGPQEALRGQLGRRRACGLASLRPCILVSAHDSALDSDSGLEPPPRDAQTCRR